MVSKNKQDALDTLEFFFEDDIMLQKFMEYFDSFTLEVDYGLYKKVKTQKLIMEGIPCIEIAHIVDLPYNSVWVIRDKFMKKNLSKHIGEK